MPRPLKVDRPVVKSISLPSSLVARVELELFSELEGKVPFAAWQRLIEHLLREKFARAERAKLPIEARREAFIRAAGFTHGWENLESWARSMVDEALERDK